MKLLPRSLLLALCTTAVCANGHAQATPTATAPAPYSPFALPEIGGSLRYALTASETVLTGYNGTTGRGASSYTNLSGELAYLSRSTTHPFSAVYGGGYLIGTSSFPSYFYQSLTLSQGFRTKNWNFQVGDGVTYVPQTPLGSLTGVPGAGDQTIAAVQINSVPTLGILTTYATRVSNTVSGTASRTLTGSTTLSFSGADYLQRYTGSSTGLQGIDNDQQSASSALQHRLSERTTVGAQYQFTNNTFRSSLLGPGSYGFQTHSAQALFTRQLSPNTSVTASVGPQWVVSGSNGGVTSGSSVSVAAGASLAYTPRRYAAALSYSRSVNNGNGVVVGSRLDSVVGNVVYPFHRIYNVGGLVGYNHSESLGNSTLLSYNNNGVVAGGQFGVQIASPLSAFAGYTVQQQNFNGTALSGIAFNGLTQYVTFGVTYSPKPFYRK